MNRVPVTVDVDRAFAARTMLRTLKTDIESDVVALEGAPFDGKTVSAYLGGLAAQVDALANVLLFMLGDESLSTFTCGQSTVLARQWDGHRYVEPTTYSGPCVHPAGHGPHHRDAAGNAWTESVR
jgi:hypothetical protein